MAGSVNKVTIVGALGKDPEVRVAQSGLKIVSFSVATSESWLDKASGERKTQTEWSRIVIMNERLAGVAEKYLKKGNKVYLEGKLQTRTWEDSGGNKKSVTEILLGKYHGELVLLERNEAPPASSASSKPAERSQSSASNTSSWDNDDEIPF